MGKGKGSENERDRVSRAFSIKDLKDGPLYIINIIIIITCLKGLCVYG
jgi:hypothetical protein